MTAEERAARLIERTLRARYIKEPFLSWLTEDIVGELVEDQLLVADPDGRRPTRG